MHGHEQSTEDAVHDLPTSRGRYGEFTLAEGDLVVFDRRDPDTWVQSSLVVDVER